MRIRQTFIVATLLCVATMAPARADTVYAYWSYWQGDSGTWTYATTGPATARAVDGAVDGWRFTLGSSGRAAQPEPDPAFDAICVATPRMEGKVRIAIVIDDGGASPAAPFVACAVVEAGLSRASALSSVAALRLNNGFICGINGIPETGCGERVASPDPEPSVAVTPAVTPAVRPTGATPIPTPAASSPRPSPTTARSQEATAPAGATNASAVVSNRAAAAHAESRAQPADFGSAWPTVAVLTGLSLVLLAAALRRRLP